MIELEKLKKEYAGLVVRAGINIQKGQRLSISCPASRLPTLMATMLAYLLLVRLWKWR